MKTKKNLFLTYSGLLILLSVLAFTTCKAGLGESVDTTPPKMNIAYPPANSIIRDWFMMSGLAEDETFVKDVTVVFKGKETHTFKADVDKEKKQWTLKVNTKSGGRYPIADGQYEVTVTATDSAGRKTSAKITYYIDNTPPVLVLQRPSTKGLLDPDLAEPFGEEIKFTGNWWDENASDGCDLKIRFFDYFDSSVSYGTVETTLPTQNWEYIIPAGEVYNALLEEIGEDGPAKPFGYTLSLSDDAKQWQTPEANMATSEVGNLSEHYYIYVHLIKLLKSGEKYPKLIELSAFDKDPTSSNIVSGIKDGAVDIRIPCDLTSWNNTMGLFSFDPYSKAPRIEIDGLKVPVGSGGVIDLLEVGNPVQPNPVFNIKINPNKDGHALQIENVKVKYQFINNDGASPIFTGEEIETIGEALKHSTIGEGFVINFSVPEATRPFRLSVNVKDLEGNEKTVMYDVFINDGAPAFKKIYPDKSPSVTKVNSFTENGKEIFIVNIEGYDGQKTVNLTIKDKDQNEIQDNSTKVSVTRTVSDEKINDVYEYKWVVKVITDGIDETKHTLQFFLDDGEYLSNRPPIKFEIDNSPPELQSLEKPVGSITIPVVDRTLINDQSVHVIGYADKDLEKALLRFVKAGDPAPLNGKENLVDWTDASVDNNPTGNTRGFNGQVPLDKGSEANEGEYTLYACFADETYDIDLENYGPVQKVLTVLYDKAVPVFTETKSGISGAALEYKKDNVHFGGKVSDANGIDSVTLTINNDEDNKIDIKPASGDDWEFEFEVGSVEDGKYPDAVYLLNFVAIDMAGKKTEFTRNIMIDTKSPSLEITAPIGGEGVSSNSYTIRGTVDDGDGKGVTELKYSLNSQDGINGIWADIIKQASWNKQGIDFSVGEEGERILWVRASDGLNQMIAKKVVFQFDKNEPELKETIVGSNATQYKKDNLTFEGTLSDTNALATSNALTVSIDNGTATEITVDGSGNWSYPFDVSSRADGTYTLVFTGTDIAGKTASLTRTVMIDKTNPTAPVIEPIDETYVENSLSISGTASDVGSGVFKTYYRIDGNEGDTPDGTLTGTDNWFKNITLTDFDEGDYKVYVWSEDRAGNKSPESSQDFKIDKSGPTFTETESGISGTGLVHKNTDVSFGGESTDGNDIASVVVSYKKDGGTSTEILNQTNGATTWSTSLPTSTGDGSYELSFTATDKVGKTTSFTRNVMIDTAPPLLDITSPSEGEGVSSSAYTIRGTVDDGSGKGVTSIEYSLDSTDGTDGTWGNITKAASWSKTGIDFSTDGQGEKILWVRASDGLNDATVKSVTFQYDTDNPELTETTIGTIDTQYRKENITLTGELTDTNDLASNPLSLSINNGVAIPITVNSGSWSYPFDVSSRTDGTYTLVFTGTDIAGRTTSLTRTIVVDKTIPTISLTTDLSGWKTGQTLAVSGTTTDATSGVSTVEYSTDGTNYSPLSGTTAWNGTIPVANGVNSLQFRAIDRAGNISNVITQSVNVDLANPELTVTSPSSLVRVNGANALNVIASAKDIDGSGVASVLVKVGSLDFASPSATANMTSGANTNGVWEASIPSTALNLADGSNHTVYVRATDLAGRTIDSTFNILIDKTPPTVSISLPTDSTVNKTIALIGTAGDAQVLSSVVLEVQKADLSWATIQTFTGSSAYNWSQADINTANYENATYPFSGGKYQFILRATAIDEAGNTASATKTYIIDQNSDRPLIRLSNLKTDGSTTLINSTVVTGSLIDDDGTVSVGNFAVSENGTTWITAISGVGNPTTPETLYYDETTRAFQYNPSSGDGNKNIYFRVTDAKGTIFTTPVTYDSGQILTYPNIQYGTDTGTSTGQSISYKVDTNPPEIHSDIHFDASDPYSFDGPNALDSEFRLLNNTLFGGNRQIFALRVSAKDAIGIASVSVKINGNTYDATKISGTIGSDEVFVTSDSTPIDVNGWASGSYDVEVSVTDTSGLISKTTRQISIDNTAPTVEITSHTENEQVTGDIIFRGTTDDGTGSGIQTVQYKVGADTLWESVDGTYSWRIEFTESTSNKITTTATYANATHATNIGAGIWRLPITIRATDKIGNIKETILHLDIDPDGDKPKVSVLYPNNGSTLGGVIRIFGSAEDNVSVKAVWMMIDTDNDGDFDATDASFLGDKGYTVEGSGTVEAPYQFKVSGTASWNMAINAVGEFNPSGSDPKSIRFRVRSQDNNDLYGNWSEVRTISVDNNAPQIGSTNPLKLVQYAGDGTTVIAEKDYVANMYIRGEWFLVGSVWDESGISTLNVTGSANRTLEGDASANPKWFIQDGLVAGTGKYNYQLRIPVGRPLSDPTAGLQSYTIFVEDASDPKGSATSNILLNYDNKSPTMTQIMRGGLVLNTTNIIEQSNRHFTIESDVTEVESGFERLVFYFVRRGNGTTTFDRLYNPMVEKGQAYNHTNLSSFTISSDGLPLYNVSGATRAGEDRLQHSNIISNYNIRKGGLVRIAGVDRVISNVNYTTGLVEFSPGVSTTHTDISFVVGQVVNNTTIETGNWTGDTLTSITNDDGDGMIESVERTGGTYHWTASINSKNIPDGPIELHYVAFDKAGNAVSGSVTTFVSNNRPKLAKVYLGTDLDGNGSFSSNELIRYYNAVSGEEESVVNLATQEFRVKGQFGLFTEFVGGNGDLGALWTTNGAEQDAWVSGYPASATTGTTATLSDVTVGGTIGTLKGVLIDSTSLEPMNDRVKLFSFSFWDQTEETSQGTTSQWALVNAPARIEVIDLVSPKAVIQPFYWNSASDNSLYNNSKANGHIELEADLPALFNQENGLFDRDPKVSGQIRIQGTAYDDQRLKELWMNIEDFTFTGAGANSNQFDTDANGTLETLARSYAPLATYSGGVWTGTDQWTANGWKMTVEDVSLTQGGHEVRWQLDLDTRRIANVAGLDKNIRIIAVDNRGTRMNASSETAANNPGDVTLNNKPSYRVDVVPYIASISTPNRTASGLKDNNIRSSDGKYSIIRGSTNNFTTITGFNLNPGNNDVRLVDTSTVALSTVTSTSGINLARNAASAPYTSFTITNNSTKSGYLEVFTNGVRALNNVNANTAKGAYTGSDELSKYNLEPDPYLRKNLLLNDDRYLRFFDMKNTGIKNAYYPEMIMDGNDPVFGYTNYAGGPSTNVGLGAGTGAGSYYASHAMPQRAKFNGTTAAEMTTEYLIKASIWDQMAMARDEGGRYHHISVYNRDNGAMSYLYDRYAELYTNGMGWGTGTGYSGYTGNWSENSNNNAITLETVNFGNGLLLGRYQYPKLIAKGNSISGAAQIYALYYDDNTTNRDLIFRNFRVGSDVTGTGTATLYVGGTSSTGENYNQRSNLADNNTSGRITAATSASRHFDYGVTSDNRVVIVYFDETAGQLKLRYSNAAVDGSSPTTNPGWTTSSVTFPDYIGNYVSMTLDSDNGIHIAAFDSSDSDLRYMYLPSYNSSDISIVTVDAAFSVGNWTQIKVRESGGDRIPYIAYYNSSETGGRDSIKLAFSKTAVSASNVPSGVNASGNVTGDWECMTVPALTPPQGGSTMFKHVCLDFDSSGTPVLGYLGTNLEFGKWLNE